jgi:hypothetical protein
MTNQELKQLCERVFQLNRTGFTSDDKPWSWRDDTRLDDCSGNILLQIDENKIKSVDNVKEIIVEYRDACPTLATEVLRLLAENEAMRGVVEAAIEVSSILQDKDGEGYVDTHTAADLAEALDKLPPGAGE